jgi:hypothetical protein
MMLVKLIRRELEAQVHTILPEFGLAMVASSFTNASMLHELL